VITVQERYRQTDRRQRTMTCVLSSFAWGHQSVPLSSCAKQQPAQNETNNRIDTVTSPPKTTRTVAV